MSDLSDFSVPWKDDIDEGLINQTMLDIGYYTHSAEKTVTPFIWNLAAIEQEIIDFHTVNALTTEQRTTVAGVVFTLMKRKWERLWNLYKTEYNPIQNYSITETENIDVETSGTDTNTGTLTNVSDSDSTRTGTVSDSGQGSRTDGVFGFNSSSAVNADTASGTSSNTRTDNLAETNDVTDTETRNLTSTSEGMSDTVRSRTMSGNIGVTTTQRMFEAELEVWQWNFFKTVFDDIDSVCCLDVY